MSMCQVAHSRVGGTYVPYWVITSKKAPETGEVSMTSQHGCNRRRYAFWVMLMYGGLFGLKE